MQLSAANLLIASQQLAHGGAKPASDAKAQFSAALAQEKGAEGTNFEPLDFKPAPRAAAPAAMPAADYRGSVRIGAQIDIRV